MTATEDLPGLPAGIVEFFQGDEFLMGGYLEYGVGGGVDDPFSGGELLRSVIPDHIGAGIGRIAQPAPAGGGFKSVQHFLGETLGIGGQGFRGNDARDLPMADGGILALALFCQPGIGAGSVAFGKAFHTVDIAQTGGDHIGDVQLGRGGAGGQGVDAHITEDGGIGHGADTERVQYDQKNPFHRFTSKNNAECEMQNAKLPEFTFCIMHSAFSVSFYLFSMATATSRATFIMVVKAVWRSAEEVSSPVMTWSEMVQMHSALLL